MLSQPAGDDGRPTARFRRIFAAGMLFLCLGAGPAHSWGDEGHEVIGLIADHYLLPAVRSKVNAMLAADATHLTASTRIDSEATWADKFRDSDRNTTETRYRQTRNWHFVDLEMQGPDLYSACFGRRPLPRNTPASEGSAEDCVVDKIEQFAAELSASTATPEERRLALQFMLHLVGDLHQPLHASDDHDQGGNAKRVAAPGGYMNNLHHYWDTEFVARLGTDAATVAEQIIATITDAQRRLWSAGTAAEWAAESFSVGRTHTYGLLPAADASGHYEISAAYVADAVDVVREQMAKAGVRLAFVLNRDLQSSGAAREGAARAVGQAGSTMTAVP